MNIKQLVTLSLSATFLTACMSASEHRQDVSSGPSTFSLGNVQSSVRQGMPQEQVVAALGSPNIVTNDNGCETWVYDKIATDSAYSASSGGGTLLGLIGAHKGAGAYETTQRTLTVMIKFDPSRRVSSINYHQSKF
jgi:outer membrane protein assembly factor BamE (lipoprotein component of BamABCDE complex)